MILYDDAIARADLASTKSSGGYMAHCPCSRHKRGDKEPSLSIDQGDGGRALLYCFAGCDFEEIVAALKLAPAHAVPILPLPRARSHDIVMTSCPKRDDRRPVKVTWYDVRDAAGVVHASHKRTDYDDGSKSVSWYQPDHETKGLAGHKLDSLPLYGSEHLAALPDGAMVVVVEGEKAAQALIDRGIAAVGTVTGASATPGPEALAVLARFDVVLWPDYDEPGRAHMERIAAGDASPGVRVFTWRNAPPKGDAADFQGDTAVLGALLNNAPAWTPPPISPDMTPAGTAARDDCGPTVELLRRRLANEEAKNGGLLALLQEIGQTVGADDRTPGEKVAMIQVALNVHDHAARHPDAAPDAGVVMPTTQVQRQTRLSRGTVDKTYTLLEHRGAITTELVDFVTTVQRNGRTVEETHQATRVIPAPAADGDATGAAVRLLRLGNTGARPAPAPRVEASKKLPQPDLPAETPMQLPEHECGAALEVVASCTDCGEVLAKRILPWGFVSKIWTLTTYRDDAHVEDLSAGEVGVCVQNLDTNPEPTPIRDLPVFHVGLHVLTPRGPGTITQVVASATGQPGAMVRYGDRSKGYELLADLAPEFHQAEMQGVAG